MAELPRDPAESDRSLSEFLSNLPRCVRLLENALRELQDDFWEEGARKRASDIAEALLDGCKVCGFRETTGILRSIHSLLGLKYGDACAIRMPLLEKLSELVGLLKEQARAASA